MDVNIAVVVLGAFILFFVIYIVRRSRQLRRYLDATNTAHSPTRAGGAVNKDNGGRGNVTVGNGDGDTSDGDTTTTTASTDTTTSTGTPDRT